MAALQPAELVRKFHAIIIGYGLMRKTRSVAGLEAKNRMEMRGGSFDARVKRSPDRDRIPAIGIACKHAGPRILPCQKWPQ
jgi:hypothetical protein